MINPISEEEQKDLDDLLRIIDGKVVCKICGVPTKFLYSTDRGYVCNQHIL